MKCPKCKRDVADEADLANDRVSVCYDKMIGEDLADDYRPVALNCLEVQLTTALADSMEIIEVLLGDAPKRLPRTTEQIRDAMTSWLDLLGDAESKAEWK